MFLGREVRAQGFGVLGSGVLGFRGFGWCFGSRDCPRADPNNRVFRAQILYHSWYLGPNTLLFGSLDP